MNSTVPRQLNHGDIRMMVCYSVIIHIIVSVFLLKFHFPAHFKEAPVYYVDILDLPVANPQAGMPSRSETPQPSPPASIPEPREMTLPTKQAAKQSASTQPKRPETTTAARDFEERIARLEREAAARHEAAAIDALRKKGASQEPVGMPGGTGTEAGSDYASYIKSRLEDAFRSTISFQSKNPEVYVKIAISQYGRITRQQFIKSSRDRLFEDSVSRAIVMAEQNLRPPPGGKQFEITVRFSPQGIGKQ